MDVREKAVSYLNSRPRTRQELIRHLKDKGFSENEILETVDELEQYHYIDDLAYSRMYFEYGFQKGRGRMRIRRELAEKGVAADVIEIAFEELEEIPDEFETAYPLRRASSEGSIRKSWSLRRSGSWRGRSAGDWREEDFPWILSIKW